MYQATCSNCGKPCEVPFRPTNGKPVYCSDCFEKMGGARRSDSPRPERSDYRAPAPSTDQNKAQFDALHAKLDKILRLLEPQVTPVSPTVVYAPVAEGGEKEAKVEEVKETKTPKAKPSSAKAPAGEEKKAKKSASKKEKTLASA
jgi:CxxC-x17-CxxC domain-containing protein